MRLAAAAAALALTSQVYGFTNQGRNTAFLQRGNGHTTERTKRFVSIQEQQVQLSEDAEAAAQVVESILSGGDSASTAVQRKTSSYLEQYAGKTGAHIVYTKLQEHGVNVVNGYSGGAILPILDQFHEDHPRHQESSKKRVRWITNSNESSAGHVAEGISKSTDTVGVAIATSGPAVTNMITPLQDAICDGVGMVVLCGQAATTAPKEAFQSAPAVAMTTPCTKWSYQVRSAAEIPFAIDYAFYVSQNGRPGPVFVDLPKDLQIQKVTPELTQAFLDSVTDIEDTAFASWVSLRNSEGDVVQALKLGGGEKGLLFDMEESDDDMKLVPHEVSTAGEGSFHFDHRPTYSITKSRVSTGDENGPSKTSPLEGSELLEEIVSLIKNAKKPIIIAGQGCNDSPEELKMLAERTQIPVTTTLHALGCFDERHPLALNMLGMHGHPTPNYMIQESDLVISVGSRFDDRITGRIGDFVPVARKAAEEGRGGVIHVDIRLSAKGTQFEPTYFVHSTAKRFLDTINDELSKESHEPPTASWVAHKKELEEKFPIKIPEFPTEDVVVEKDGESMTLKRTAMSAQYVVRELNQQLLDAGVMDDVIFSTGVGIHQMAAAQLITWTQPKQMISSGSLGTMGVALGYAIGAKLGNMSKIVIAIDGDGSFNMTFTELKTLVEHNVPIRLIILDNESQMMVEYWQRLFHDSRYLAVRNHYNPEYTTLADAFGIKNLYCDCTEELPNMMKQFLFDDSEKPVLFHVKINRTPCLPLVAPGKPLQEMILEDKDFEVDPNAAPS
mmetsp:Transcript_22722/g.34735  ORF Transcript_22722/g.34735 Transcript_22722/m.34735 type:complete len:784 (-) Transcript_22722:343-2694(-)|eukprot:CAMPEP_0118691414 /NCGR_PEP_ID=MMETSP0800-20121206/10669_1 /TAXON_ID=210618 ORGANISM="Striatella unipunctata, Strain CCMP2910" /NCGR_SAMPLE_ID=MMETSP0800 /ASSEMBLY_ACC=CAM_ASM_000638 /LENGTH=783 /DNA_ID=CAMNT_0006589195 /DNA_START=131 /DNA_END=2482 /DNA_ORIENTATION=-